MNEQDMNRRIIWCLVDQLGGHVNLDMDVVTEMDMVNNSLSVDTEHKPNAITIRALRHQLRE